MINFRFAEIVREDGSVRRLPYQRALAYHDNLERNLSDLSARVKDSPDEPSHFNSPSTQHNRHIRDGETLQCFLPRSVADARVKLTPYFRWKTPELRGGVHMNHCLCLKRNGMQVWCPRWGCRGSVRCVAGRPGFPRDPDVPVEPSCCESWKQRAKEADLQLYLYSRPEVVPRGLY